MSDLLSTKTSKKKVICHVPTLNQLQTIKPIEVTCFLDENRITIETNDTPQKDVTATMMTFVPQVKRPIKTKPAAKVMDLVITKPIRHLAILPSSKEFSEHPTDLSETFTTYGGPTTTPDVARSLEEDPAMMNREIPTNLELKLHDTTVSSTCELIDQAKLIKCSDLKQQKPHSLIGRFQSTNTDPATNSTPSVHIASVHYGESQAPETVNKQLLIQQFYTQLEKMKATFTPEPAGQLTTNTFTFDNGQVTQTSATNQLQEKTTTVTRASSATTLPKKNKPPPTPKKQKTTKNPSTRIHSAPVPMATRVPTDRKANPRLPSSTSCKQRRPEKKSIPIKNKPIRRVESAPVNRIDIRPAEVTLLPHDEQECQQMYEKLQRLQPNGVCVDMNTLRRALYPPVGSTAYSANSNEQPTTAFRFYGQRREEIPQSWTKVDDTYVSKYVPKQSSKIESDLIMATDNTNIDRIVDQVKKHAAINYSYYTRTK